MFYFIKTPRWLKKLFGAFTWDMGTAEKRIYLSFDDGPHPVVTPFVLDELKRAGAKATFFCIGKNVAEYPAIYQRIIDEGHSVGNHTFDHVNGWKTKDELYFDNIEAAVKFVRSKLFRPPYGRIKRTQGRKLLKDGYQVIMWDVISGDFDGSISKHTCLNHVIKNTVPGSIVVFHDSEKAYERMSYALTETLKYFSQKGYSFQKI